LGTRNVGSFVEAGRTLFSLGLIKASEGNLSTWDGDELVITRTGCELASLGPADVLVGTLEDPPQEASSDLEVHLAYYRQRGPGALAHAHPPGTVPEGAPEAGEHGAYAFADSLAAAVGQIVEDARAL
jgi:ribulose-5-phosphate 4-epimerase/fuculose-1-phosphate aldolase